MTNGTVQIGGEEAESVTGTIVSPARTAQVVTAENSDGVIATAENGIFTEIKDLEATELVTFVSATGVTYSFKGFGSTLTRILELTGNGLNYVSMTKTADTADTMNLLNGVNALQGADGVIYGTNTTYAGSFFAKLSSESASAFTFTKNGDSNSETVASPIIDINNVATSTGVTLGFDFAASIYAGDGASTDTTIAYTLNSATFLAASAITVSGSVDSNSTLYEGTVALSDTYSFVAATNSGTAKIETGVIFAKAAEGQLTEISGIDKDEKFTLAFNGTSSTYLSTARGLAVDEDSNGVYDFIYTEIGSESSTFAINGDNASTTLLNATGDGVLELQSGTGNAYFVQTTSDPQVFYTALEVTGDGEKTYKFDKLDSDATAINATAINSDATFSISFNANVSVGAEGATNTFTVNSLPYMAISALDIVASDTKSALNAGTVLVGVKESAASELTTVDTLVLKNINNETDGVQAIASDGRLTSISDLEDGVSLVYSGTSYAMTGSILRVTKDGATTMYANSSEATNILDLADSDTVNYVAMTGTDSNTMVLKSGFEKLSSGTVLYGTMPEDDFNGTYFATLGSTTSTAFTLTKNAGAGSETVTNPLVDASSMDASSGLTLTLDFNAQVLTSSTGLYTINDTNFSATSVLTINASDTTTLYEGTVGLSTGTYAAVTATNSGTVTVNTGEITATAKGGIITQIGGIDEVGEMFTVESGTTKTAYKLATAGLLKDDGADGSFEGIMLNFDSGTGTYDFTGTFTNLLEAPNGAITLTSETGVFVDSKSAPNTFYASVARESANTFTFTGLNDVASTTKIDATANFKDGVTLNVNFNLDKILVGAQTADTNTTVDFTVNNETYKSLSELTIASTGTGTENTFTSTLSEGQVKVMSGTGLTFTTTDGKKITSVANDSDGVVVKVANGSATSITDLENGVTVVYDSGTYVMGSTTLITTVNGVRKEYTLGDRTNESINILDLKDLSPTVYIQIKEDGVVRLDRGVAAFRENGNVENVTYGTETELGDDYFGQLFYDKDKDLYTLNKNGGETVNNPVVYTTEEDGVKTVEITTATDGADVYYTTDGTTA